MNIRSGYMVATLSLSVLIPVKNSTFLDSESARAITVMPPVMTGMRKCPDDVHPSTVVRIWIPKDFDLRKRKSRIRARDNDPSSESGPKSASTGDDTGDWYASKPLKHSSDAVYNSNPFHFSFSQVDGGVVGSYVKFRVFLEDDDYEFASLPKPPRWKL